MESKLDNELDDGYSSGNSSESDSWVDDLGTLPHAVEKDEDVSPKSVDDVKMNQTNNAISTKKVDAGNDASDCESESESFVIVNINDAQDIEKCAANQNATDKINNRNFHEECDKTIRMDSEDEEVVNISTNVTAPMVTEANVEEKAEEESPVTMDKKESKFDNVEIDYSKFKPGMKALRKGKEVRIKSLDFSMEPPSVNVELISENNRQINTELHLLKPYEEKALPNSEIFDLGIYRVNVGKTNSRSTKFMESSVVHKYKRGNVVDVVEIVEVAEENRIRGRLDTIPESWITLMNTDTGKKLFEKVGENTASKNAQTFTERYGKQSEEFNNQVNNVICGLVLFTRYGALIASIKDPYYRYRINPRTNVSIPLLGNEASESPLETAIRGFKELSGCTEFEQMAVLNEVISYEQEGNLTLLFPAYIELDEMEVQKLEQSNNNLEWVPTKKFRRNFLHVRANVPTNHIERSFNLLEVHKQDIIIKIREQNTELAETVELALKIFLEFLCVVNRLKTISRDEIKSFFYSNPEDLMNVFDADREELDRMRQKLVAQLPTNQNSTIYVEPKIPIDLYVKPDIPIVCDKNNYVSDAEYDLNKYGYFDDNKHPLRKAVYSPESNEKVQFTKPKKSEKWTPGTYRIIKKSFSTKTELRNSERVIGYTFNDIVKIVEIKDVKEEHRIRGRLDTIPASWISLQDTQKGKSWVQKVKSGVKINKATDLYCQTCGLKQKDGRDMYRYSNYWLCENCYITFAEEKYKKFKPKEAKKKAANSEPSFNNLIQNPKGKEPKTKSSFNDLIQNPKGKEPQTKPSFNDLIQNPKGKEPKKTVIEKEEAKPLTVIEEFEKLNKNETSSSSENKTNESDNYIADNEQIFDFLINTSHNPVMENSPLDNLEHLILSSKDPSSGNLLWGTLALELKYAPWINDDNVQTVLAAGVWEEGEFPQACEEYEFSMMQMLQLLKNEKKQTKV